MNSELYNDKSIITDRTIHDNRPGRIMFDKTIKATHSVDVAISNSHSLHSTNHRESPGVYRLERRAYENMATENGLYNTASAIQKRIVSNNLHESLTL